MKNLLDKIPNSIKTLAWNILYQLISFAALTTLEGIQGLEVDNAYKILFGLVLSAVSKWAMTKNK